jgi:hypothetical protein
MKEEAIDFMKQLAVNLEDKIFKLEEAKKNNNSQKFNLLKRDAFNIYQEMERLIKS